jgi:hypothetical protein
MREIAPDWQKLKARYKSSTHTGFGRVTLKSRDMDGQEFWANIANSQEQISSS